MFSEFYEWFSCVSYCVLAVKGTDWEVFNKGFWTITFGLGKKKFCPDALLAIINDWLLSIMFEVGLNGCLLVDKMTDELLFITLISGFYNLKLTV